MTEIVLSIKNCAKCPYVDKTLYPTEDSWEEAYNFYCTKTNNKKIAEYVEWHEELPDVPDWCPIRKDKIS